MILCQSSDKILSVASRCSWNKVWIPCHDVQGPVESALPCHCPTLTLLPPHSLFYGQLQAFHMISQFLTEGSSYLKQSSSPPRSTESLSPHPVWVPHCFIPPVNYFEYFWCVFIDHLALTLECRAFTFPSHIPVHVAISLSCARGYCSYTKRPAPNRCSMNFNWMDKVSGVS